MKIKISTLTTTYCSSGLMGKPKIGRKSVSFQHLNDETEVPKGKGEVNQSESNNSNKNEDTRKLIPSIKSPILAIPFHNILILWGMFYYGLTENPAAVMTKGLYTLFPIQLMYNITLYGNISKPKKESINVPLLVGGSLVMSGVFAVPLFAILVLFGAPLASHLYETFILAIHLSVLFFNPLLILFKFDINTFNNIFKVERIYRLIFRNLVLASSLLIPVGTWIGVIPIPLDWDRPWQQWPITLLCGGYIGSVVGGLLSLVCC